MKIKKSSNLSDILASSLLRPLLLWSLHAMDQFTSARASPSIEKLFSKHFSTFDLNGYCRPSMPQGFGKPSTLLYLLLAVIQLRPFHVLLNCKLT